LGLAGDEPVRTLLRSWQFQSPNRAAQTAEPSMSNATAAPEQSAYVPANSLPELLSLEGAEFVQSAYATMLGREADPEGEEYYTSRLERGFPKLQILNQMRQSPEARLHPNPLPGLQKAFRDYRIAALVRGKKKGGQLVQARILNAWCVPHVSHFLQYYDEDFVRVVYSFYLGREPDAAGLQYYTDRIRHGVSRQQILIDIARSGESRRRGRRALGERAVSRALAAERIPLLGTALALMKFQMGLKRHLQDMRALHNHLYRITKRIG
jgi:hypothetical protein